MELLAKVLGSSAVMVASTVLSGMHSSAEAITLTGGQNSKTGSTSKLWFDLAEMVGEAIAQPVGSSSLLQTHRDYVVIDAVAAEDTKALLTELEGLGLQSASISDSLVSGLLPINALSQMASLDSLKFAKPAYKPLTNIGLTTSQADFAVQANVARSKFGVDGTGITVGVLSDSFDNLGGAAEDIASGDLPPAINVLKDLPSDDPRGGIDEGRAMMQLIHDLAPSANLAFRTGFLGQADFANGIIELANAGADVIVDDLFYVEAPMFQDGIVAQAVDAVVARGVSYFSSAGNRHRLSYESAFNPSGLFEPAFGSELHDFDPGEGVDVLQSITVPVNTGIAISFQWDSPFFSVSGGAGSANDLDIFLLDDLGSDLSNVLASSTTRNIGKDALEIFEFFNDGSFGTDQFNLAISNFAGPDPGFIKYVLFGLTSAINEYDTASGTVFGHKNARGAEAVGAAFYGYTPEFGVNPAVLEFYSSAGSVPILFDTAGNRLASPEIRLKPEIVAPDGVNTTFFGQFDIEGDGLLNFFGTSAAAPHAAAVAALMLDANPNLSPAEVYAILENTALDMGEPGVDFDSGYGLIQADRAVAAAIAARSVPEPNFILSLSVLGALGVGSQLKGKHQQA